MATYNQRQLRGTILTFLSCAMFGLLGYLGTKLVHNHFSIENMLFWRFLVASIWMLGLMMMHKRSHLLASLKHGSLTKIFLLGAFSYSASSLFYFLSSGHIGTGPAMVIFYSFPVFVAMFLWCDGSWRMNKIAAAALIAVIIGLLMIKGNGEQTMNWLGIVFGLIAAISYAAYVYGSSKYTLKNLDTTFLTLLVCLGNTLIFWIMSLYTQTFSYPTTAHDWFYTCAIGVIATALPIQLLLDGLKYISPVKASVISVIEPVVTVLMGIALLNESLSLEQSAGILVVLFGALLIQFERSMEGA
jgi:drug/metabolite transporter (DMT)-like permease